MIPITASSCSLYCHDLPALKVSSGVTFIHILITNTLQYMSELSADHEIQEQAHECVRWTLRCRVWNLISLNSRPTFMVSGSAQASYLIFLSGFVLSKCNKCDRNMFKCEGFPVLQSGSVFQQRGEKNIIIIDVIMFRLWHFFLHIDQISAVSQSGSMRRSGPLGSHLRSTHIGSVRIKKKKSLPQHSMPSFCLIYIYNKTKCCIIHHTASICFHFKNLLKLRACRPSDQLAEQ